MFREHQTQQGLCPPLFLVMRNLPRRALGSSPVVLYYRGPESPDLGELWDCQHQLLFTSPRGESRHKEQPWMLF